MSCLTESGRDAARRLWRDGLAATIDDPLDKEFADAAVRELVRLQESTPGILRDALEGAEISAEQLNVEPFHGVVEVVQNADDTGASEVRVALRTRSRGRDLLFVHDGDPIELGDLIAMALAFVSTKREDSLSKGRFGIGLKTLSRLGDTLTVHCGPYHASIVGNRISPAPPAPLIDGFYRPEAGETLLELRLRSSFDADGFRRWFGRWQTSSMLFLDTVRSIRLVNVRSRKPTVDLRLDERRLETRPLMIGRHSLECEETILKDPATGAMWRRYLVHRPVPPSVEVKRLYKKTGKTTPLAVAVPDMPEASGRLFAGLPLASRLGAPFSLSGQFDVDTPRTAAQHDSWNGWLLDRLMELVLAVALRRFSEQPRTGWAAVPLMSEAEGIEDEWLRQKFSQGVISIQQRLVRAVRFDVRGTECRLRDLAYESRQLERLLDEDDLAGLYPELTPMARSFRDRQGRWHAVLSELQQGTEVSAADALRVLDRDEMAAERPVSWFIRFARAAIAAGEGDRLLWRRAIVLADGSRIVPPAPHVEAEVLVRKARPASLAHKLGLARVIHPAYLTANPEAAAVRRWLEGGGILVDGVGDEAALRALAERGSSGEGEPIDLSDDDLRALRDALISLGREDQEQLGPEIGQAVAIRGFRWEHGKRVRAAVVPADAYLPATLEDRPDGWGKAAGTALGISWIETRYGDVLKRKKGDRRTPAALAFLRLLGAEVAPRLIEPSHFDTRYGDPASPIEFSTLTTTQREALGGVHATHLKREHLSPDLGRVVTDIARERSRRRRRDRARALVATLDREWKRLYEGRETATAVYSSSSWYRATTLPATWLAVAMDSTWLTNEAGTPSSPSTLIVRTVQTEALYGPDAEAYAAEIGREVAASPAVRALGVTTDPRVSEVVEQLNGLRASVDEVDPAEAAIRYAAIAAAVTNVDAALDSMVGDLTVRQLRGRFGADRRKPGLILVDGRWLAPGQVLRGKPIFGKRRPFVPDRSHADRLWRILGIATPTVSECVTVLREIARSKVTDEDEQTLLDIYVYLSDRLADASRSELRAIASLPLWSGSHWLKDRPVYATEDTDVTRELSAKLPVWRSPVSPRALGRLVDALDVTLLADRDFTPLIAEAERVAGDAIRDHFASAVAHLREWLARHDPSLYEALGVSWDALANAEIALAPNLHLELRIPSRRAMRVAARAHVTRDPLAFAFADIDDIGSDDGGGRAVAALFTAGDELRDRDKVALAWIAAWTRARLGDRSARMRLAEDLEDDTSLENLFEQAARNSKGGRRPPRPKRTEKQTVQEGRLASPAAAVRRLKDPDDLVVESVTRPDGPDMSRQPRGSRGLRADRPSGRSIDPSTPAPAPRSAPLAYSPQQQEHVALIALHRAINGELSGLKDFRHLQGVGADALDELERAFEIKSFATAMPDQVTLTANEFERALQDGSKYYLAVIAGLEEGYETVVRVIADPVHTLDVQKSTTLVLGGVRSAKKPIEVRFATGPPGTSDPQG